jgi:hypothetical protein
MHPPLVPHVASGAASNGNTRPPTHAEASMLIAARIVRTESGRRVPVIAHRSACEVVKRHKTCRRGEAHESALSARERAFTVAIVEGEAVSARMVGAPAQEEIDEPTGKFLRPRSHIAHLELLA